MIKYNENNEIFIFIKYKMSADLIDPPHGMSGVCGHCHGMNGEDVRKRCQRKCRKLTITARNMAGESFEIGDVCSGIRIGLLKYLVCRIVFNYECLYHHMGMSIVDDNYAVLENLDHADDVISLLEKHIGRGDTLTLAVACNGPILSDRQRRLLPRLNNERRVRLLHRIENRVAELQPTQLAAPQPLVFTPAPVQRNQSRQLQLTSSPHSPSAVVAASSSSSGLDGEYGDLYGMRKKAKKSSKRVRKVKKSAKKVKKSAKGSKKVKKSVKGSKKVKKSAKSVRKSKKSVKSVRKTKKRV